MQKYTALLFFALGATASPIAAPQPQGIVDRCAAQAAVLRVLAGYSSATPFCSSYLKISTSTTTTTSTSTIPTTVYVTETTSTNVITGAAVTVTAPMSTATASTSTTTSTHSPPVQVTAAAMTVTAPASTFTAPATTSTSVAEPVTITAESVSTIAAEPTTVVSTITSAAAGSCAAEPEKRQLNLGLGMLGLPPILAGFAPTRVSSACSCLSIRTPTSTVTATATTRPTVHQTINENAASTVTPTSTSTPVTTITPIATEHITYTVTDYPTATSTPVTTVTPVVTAFETPTITHVGSTTYTPTVTTFTTVAGQASGLAVAKCPEGDATTYTACDGSQWRLVCKQEYNAKGIPGLPPFTSDSFEACIDRCRNQGTACMGVTYAASSKQCHMKKAMSEIKDSSTSAVFNAVRVSGPASMAAPNFVITNGGFDDGLAPWATRGRDGAEFTDQNGRATLGSSSATCRQRFGCSPFAELSQQVSLAAGSHVHFRANLGVNVASGAFCYVSVITRTAEYSEQQLYTANFESSSSFDGEIVGSVTLDAEATSFNLLAGCGDELTPETTIFFDNVLVQTYGRDNGVKPQVPQRTSLLVNGNFESGSLDPWKVSANTPARANLENGEVVLRMDPLPAPRFNSQTPFVTQDLNLDAGQTFRAQAKVRFALPANNAVSCIAVLRSNSQIFWNVDNVSASRTVNVDVTGKIEQDGTYFGVAASCRGTGVPAIYVDDMVFEVNV